MSKFIFTPYDLEKWNQSKERILFVAPEPNGNQPDGGNHDMGEWFRTASPQNNYHGNKNFYMRCYYLMESFNKSSIGVFDNFRLIDLKATPGSGQSNKDDIHRYVQEHLPEVLKFFQTEDEDFGLSPQIVVLLGGKTQPVFKDLIKPKLQGTDLKCVGFTHPTAMVNNDAVIQASLKIRDHLRSVNSKMLEKWVYKKDNFDYWETF